MLVLSSLRRIPESFATPVVLLLAFVGAIIWSIDLNSPWYDESYTLALVLPHDLVEITKLTAVDSHPPLWYWVVKAWTYVAGSTLFSIRLHAALCMIAALAIWYRFARSHFSPSVAAFALLLAVTNPTVLRYACEARMYAFGILLTAMSTSLLAMPRTRRTTIAYWVVAVTMLYTHYFLLFVVCAQMLFLLVRRREHALQAWHVVAFGASIVLAFTPWIPVLLSRTSYTAEHGFWIPPVSPNVLLQYVSETFLHRADWQLQGGKNLAALGFYACLAWALAKSASRESRSLLLWCLYLVPIASLLVISTWTPLFYPRYVIFGLPALLLLLASGALAVRGRWRLVVASALVIGSLAGLARAVQKNAFRMRQIAAIVEQPVDGELPSVVVVWPFAFLDAKVTIDPSLRVVESRGAPPVYAVNEALYHDKRDWYVLDLGEVSTRHAWTIEDQNQPPPELPSHWRSMRSVIRGYVRARLWEIGPPSPPSGEGEGERLQ